MEARKDGRGKRQKQAPRAVGRQVAGQETSEAVSEDVQFDFNATRISAQSVDKDVKRENGKGGSGVETGPVGAAEVHADDEGGQHKKRSRSVRALEVRLELSLEESDGAQGDWVMSAMLGEPMARLMANKARRE